MKKSDVVSALCLRTPGCKAVRATSCTSACRRGCRFCSPDSRKLIWAPSTAVLINASCFWLSSPPPPPPPPRTNNNIIIIIIAFKGAIRDFFLQSPRSAANCLQPVRSSGPGAIVCKSRATHRALITCKCHVTCHLVRRNTSAIKFGRVEIAFI